MATVALLPTSNRSTWYLLSFLTPEHKQICKVSHLPLRTFKGFWKDVKMPFSPSYLLVCSGWDTLISQKKKKKKGGGAGRVAQAVECWPSKHKALSSNPSIP
jgi:hypothetical protein